MATTVVKRYWVGDAPKYSDISKRPITDTFVDGKTKSGPWGYMLPEEHARHGIGLGLGKGQMYKLQADGRWLKVEG